jgi:hypothetical protein
MTTEPSTQYSTEYTSKWGKVIIFNGENYPLFSITCKAALVSANAWGIVSRAEPAPVGARPLEEWNKRRNFAIQIIFSSAGKNYVNSLSTHLDNNDPAGMWEKLKASDRSRDAVFISNIRTSFASQLFDPLKQSIRQFLNTLEHYRTQISATDNPITDLELRNKILQALPISDGVWQQAKMWCLRDNSTLEETINVLESHEQQRPPPEATATAAAATHKRKEWKGKDNKRESRSQDSRSHRQSRQQQDRSRSRSRSRTRSRFRSCSRSHSPSDRLKCYFCKRKGHIQRDCKKYLKAKKQAEEDSSSGDDKAKRSKSRDKHKAKETTYYSYVNADDSTL